MEGANIAHITVRDNESLESALRRFKKKVENEGIIKEFKERQYFVKPSLLRHEQKRAILHKANRKKSSSEKKMSRSKKRKKTSNSNR